jgi:serine/threonine protein phosphatase PrpC
MSQSAAHFPPIEPLMDKNVGIISIRGHRDQMEDYYTLQQNFGGVYDGHGGFEVAEYVAKNLPTRFFNTLVNQKPESAFSQTYETISKEVAGMKGGACAANFFLQEGDIFYSSVGDCRIIIVGVEKTQLTTDHNVTIPEERDRVERAGGLIKGRYVFKDYRGLAVSRSLGDPFHQQVGIISTPDTGLYHTKPNDKYLIAASDGLFGKVDNEEVARYVLSIRTDAQTIAEGLKDAALAAGSKDNITVLVVALTA